MTSDLSQLPSQYDHAAAQKKWYPFWEERGYFHADENDDRPPYTIVIPPPNVTGALHLGHALNNTLQDILCRMKRMQGFNVLWMPGTDHAGIATQAVVERRLLEEEKLSRHDLGREKLVDRIWDWKKQYETRILGQLKQMGFSCDWQRLRFTLDETCARAVRETFFKLFKDNKIYRGKRLVNWDTFLQTAVSDDEVFHDPVKGHFWHFKYPVVGIDGKGPQPGEPKFVTIATTRPETMLGDTAVAVHPDPAAALNKVKKDLQTKLAAASEKETPPLASSLESVTQRLSSKLPELEQLRDMALAGRMLQLPLTDRQIPLVVDPWAKPEMGSGCVKITPAHDHNDYEVGLRQKLPMINILNTNGTLNDNVPEKYRGLTMKKARAAVVADLEEQGLLVEIEDREIDLAHSDRSKTPIEPYLADQWFVKMDELAQSAMDAVTDGRVKIIPERYAKGYQDWLSEKRDWPIGRQLWWGHRIPIWSVTLKASQNRDKTLPLEESVEQFRQEFLDALGKYARAFGIKGDVIASASEKSETIYYICVRSELAQEVIEALYGRRNRTRPTGLYDKDPTLVPDLLTTDPRREFETHLNDCISIINDQESDVLDTWFSSALWPHSTLGWPEKTPELKKFYPTAALITSRDIITLWVARMVLTGLYNMGEVPFSEVYIHPKILDGYGETMSKSKGNGVDPLDVIEKFGADALRFGIAYLTTETQDVRMPVEFECPHCQAMIQQTKKNRRLPRVECNKCGKPFSTQWAETDDDRALPRGSVVSERFELGRNFCNKLWNASRFALMNLNDYEATSVPDENLLLEDRWLLSRLATITEQVTEALTQYRFADAARTLYSFAWDDFCSFYVEMTKTRFAVPEQRATAQRVLAHALDTLLRLLHPMIPFLTEEVWQLLATVAPDRGLTSPARQAESVCIAPWPEVDATHADAKIEQQFAQFQAVLGAVRETRMGQNIPPKEPIQFCVRCDAAAAALLKPMQPYFTQMARATATAWGPEVTVPEMAASVTLSGMEVHVDISAFFDVDAEQKRLTSEKEKLAKFVKSLQGKLNNENFTSRAPAEVVQQQRDKLAEVREQLGKVEVALAKLRK